MFQFIILLQILNLLTTQEQEPCAFNLTIPGKCVCLEECDYAVQLLKKGGKPQTCYFEHNYPIVCCPQQLQELKNVNVAKTKCEEIKNLYQPKLRGFILGGTHAKSQEYVHMAILGYGKETDQIEWLCGGSLISDRFILTAAHCLNSRDYGPLKWVRLGELDLHKTDESDSIDFKIKTFIKHPDYRPSSKYNDIALLELETKVNFTPYIKPACINSEETLHHKRFYATGWGLLNIDGKKSEHLQEVELNLSSDEECKLAYEIRRQLKDGIINTQFCAGGNFKDTCLGDSGGPLQYPNNETNGYRGYTVIGVTSFGKHCGITSSPGVYTRVLSFVPWIKSIVWPNEIKNVIKGV